VFGFHPTLGCFHINTETYVSMYSSIKYMRKASVVFRVYRTFTSATCNTVDHILTGRSHIGRAANNDVCLK